MEKISTVIITFNEEANIRQCLETVKWTDEIIVVDRLSTDNTVKICRKFSKKIKILKRKWEGYSKQKNFGIKKTKNNWVLSVDSDERITPQLEQEIKHILSSKKDHAGYNIPRKNFYFNKWVKWGGNYPDYQLRLFNKKYGGFKIVPVHEGIRVKGKVLNLKNPMLHLSYTNLNDYFKRFIRYTDLEKNILISRKVKINPFTLFYHIFFIPCKKFISRFVFKLGFLDGLTGLMVLKLNNITKIISFYKYYLWYREKKM